MSIGSSTSRPRSVRCAVPGLGALLAGDDAARPGRGRGAQPARRVLAAAGGAPRGRRRLTRAHRPRLNKLLQGNLRSAHARARFHLLREEGPADATSSYGEALRAGLGLCRRLGRTGHLSVGVQPDHADERRSDRNAGRQAPDHLPGDRRGAVRRQVELSPAARQRSLNAYYLLLEGSREASRSTSSTAAPDRVARRRSSSAIRSPPTRSPPASPEHPTTGTSCSTAS
jgi:hypothetical protein